MNGMDRERLAAVEAELQAVSSFPGIYSSFAWKNIGITFWFGPVTLESCNPYERGCRAQIEQHPEGLSSVNIMVPGGSSLPSAEARAEIGRIVRDLGKHAAAMPIIVPGTGFWASAMRSLVAALAMMRPRETQLQVFGTARELAEWLPPIHVARTGVQLQAAELLSVLQAAERMAAATRAAAA
jgi:hypothetical protein